MTIRVAFENFLNPNFYLFLGTWKMQWLVTTNRSHIWWIWELFQGKCIAAYSYRKLLARPRSTGLRKSRRFTQSWNQWWHLKVVIANFPKNGHVKGCITCILLELTSWSFGENWYKVKLPWVLSLPIFNHLGCSFADFCSSWRLLQLMIEEKSGPEMMTESAVVLGSLAKGTEDNVQGLIDTGSVSVLLKGE